MTLYYLILDRSTPQSMAKRRATHAQCASTSHCLLQGTCMGCNGTATREGTRAVSFVLFWGEGGSGLTSQANLAHTTNEMKPPRHAALLGTHQAAVFALGLGNYLGLSKCSVQGLLHPPACSTTLACFTQLVCTALCACSAVSACFGLPGYLQAWCQG